MSLTRELEFQGNFLFKYRSYFPILILVVGTILIFEFKPEHKLQYEIICFLISLTGLLIRILSVGYAGKNTSGRNTKDQVADELNTTGMYSIIRHPLYLGNFMMSLGVAFLIQSWSFVMIFTLLYWMYYERIMFAEEKYLIRKFGKQFLSWSRNTPLVIPSKAMWQKPVYSFDFFRAIRNEKTTLLSFSAIFLFFEICKSVAINTSLVGLEFTWVFFFLAALLFYIAVKILKI